MQRAMVFLAALLAWAGTAEATNWCPPVPMEPYAFETITVSTTSIGFTTATYIPDGTRPGDMAIVTVESQAVRFRGDGLAPTASVGHIAAVDSTITVCGERAIRKLRFIRKDAVDATLSVSFYRVAP